MSKYNLKEIKDKNEWEEFLSSRNPGTFLQSWNWGEVNRALSYKIIRLGVYRKKSIVACAQLIQQPAKRGPHYLIPGGPVLDYKDKPLFDFFIENINKIAKNENVWFVRVRPDVEDSKHMRLVFKNKNFIYAPMHVHGEHTIVLNVNKNEDEILGQMRKNTRYLIRKSLKEGFEMETSAEPNLVKILYDLQKQTVKRHKFVGFSEKIFRAQLESFGKDRQAELFICRKGGRAMVAAIVIYYGQKAFYHHSASSEESRATNASYFTQWQIIRRVRKLGLKYYDLWGIAPTDNPKHRFSGVTIFKKGFGGTKLDYLHAHDMVLSPKYYLTYIFETLRRKLRHL